MAQGIALLSPATVAREVSSGMVEAERRVGIAKAIPLGVSLDREKVEAQLRRRKEAWPTPPDPYADWVETEALIARALPLEVALGEAPVLWEASTARTQHLLCAGPRKGLEAFRRILLSHAVRHKDSWKPFVLDTEESQKAALGRSVREHQAAAVRGRRGVGEGRPCLLFVVENPKTQEALALLTEFAAKASAARVVQVNLAVLTDDPTGLPTALLRRLGFRVALSGVSRGSSRDVVGDESAATLPSSLADRLLVGSPAVIYDEERGRRDVCLYQTTEADLQALKRGLGKSGGGCS